MRSLRSLLALTTLTGALALNVACEGDDINLLTIEDDMQLGADLDAEIMADPKNYPILDRDEYAEAYGYLEDMKFDILDSGKVEYADTFEWKLTILDDDEVLNAFAAPGGYIYVYTGLIRYLEAEDHLAGVMGHEIAHADKRHSTEQLTKAYGISALLGIVFGRNPGLAAEIGASLVNLSFSRADEAESDEWSVIYLCETDYAADGAAGFFAKIVSETEEGSVGIPEFASTHPSSEGRVEDIEFEAAERGCSTDPIGKKKSRWKELLAALP